MNLFRRLWLLVTLVASVGAAQGQGQSGSVDYVLGAGDVVRITVFQSPDLTLEARIAESGVISYPLVGTIKLGGLPVSEAEKRIADGLKSGNFLKLPQVSILVLQIRGNQASVLGQVLRPGRFPLEQANMRLSDLLALAGGIAPSGNELVTLSGLRAGKAVRVQIDFPTIFSGTTDDMIVQNGDVVYVDRMPMVYIYGEVQRPGAFRIERGMTMMQALATAGGVTQRGTEKGIRIHRRGPDGKVQVVQPTMDDTVKDNDVVYVRESLF